MLISCGLYRVSSRVTENYVVKIVTKARTTSTLQLQRPDDQKRVSALQECISNHKEPLGEESNDVLTSIGISEDGKKKFVF